MCFTRSQTYYDGESYVTVARLRDMFDKHETMGRINCNVRLEIILLKYKLKRLERRATKQGVEYFERTSVL